PTRKPLSPPARGRRHSPDRGSQGRGLQNRPAADTRPGGPEIADSKKNLSAALRRRPAVVGDGGFEPPTSTMSTWRSTPELIARPAVPDAAGTAEGRRRYWSLPRSATRAVSRAARRGAPRPRRGPPASPGGGRNPRRPSRGGRSPGPTRSAPPAADGAPGAAPGSAARPRARRGPAGRC